MGFNKFIKAAIAGEPIRLLGDGEQTRDFTLNQVLKMLGTITGRRLIIAADPVQKGDMRHTYADTSLAQADLGFAPKVSLEAGLTAEYEWLEESMAMSTCRSRSGS